MKVVRWLAGLVLDVLIAVTGVSILKEGDDR